MGFRLGFLFPFFPNSDDLEMGEKEKKIYEVVDTLLMKPGDRLFVFAASNVNSPKMNSAVLLKNLQKKLPTTEIYSMMGSLALTSLILTLSQCFFRACSHTLHAKNTFCSVFSFA